MSGLLLHTWLAVESYCPLSQETAIIRSSVPTLSKKIIPTGHVDCLYNYEGLRREGDPPLSIQLLSSTYCMQLCLSCMRFLGGDRAYKRDVKGKGPDLRSYWDAFMPAG